MRCIGVALALVVLAGACGDDGEEMATPTAAATTGGDGVLRPPGDGTRLTEAEACDQLRDAYVGRRQELCGVATAPTCPNFVRVAYDPDCVEFDGGSVQGCVDYYNAAESCDELVVEACEAAVFAGSEPAGCP